MELSKLEPETCQATYQITLKGKLDQKWSDWFNGVTITLQDEVTTLTGADMDQAKLRGVLNRIWDLSLIVVSLNRIEPKEARTHPQPGGKQWENC